VFGPRFDKGPDERIERFCDWLVIDPRSIDAASLERKYLEWHDQEKNQYEREDEKVEP
jgi:hypothetical protein